MSIKSKSYGTRVFSAFLHIFSFAWKIMFWTAGVATVILFVNSFLYACKISCFSPVQVLNAMTWLTTPVMEALDQLLPSVSWWIRFCSSFWDTSMLVYVLAIEAGCIGLLVGCIRFMVELLNFSSIHAS